MHPPMSATLQAAIERLDEFQRAAAMHNGGAAMVLAGPGSGKTETMSVRHARLVSEDVNPSGILTLTFTKKAAEEMASRIARRLDIDPQDATGWPIGTMHSIFYSILRTPPFMEALGLRGARLLLKPAQYALLAANQIRWNRENGEILDYIAGWKDRMVTPEQAMLDVMAGIDALGRPFESAVIRKNLETAVLVYRAYEAALRAGGAIDFSDMISLPLQAMRDHPELARMVAGRYSHIMVDEYQDTNPAQHELIRRVTDAQAMQDLWVVGDDDQSIYGFRGATPGIMTDFQKDFARSALYNLRSNYRSSPHIITAAEALIRGNENRFDKNPVCVRGPSRESWQPVTVLRIGGTPDDEATHLATRIKTLVDRTGSHAGLAVLGRLKVSLLPIRSAMRSLGLPINSDIDIWRDTPVKRVLAMMRIAMATASGHEPMPDDIQSLGRGQTSDSMRANAFGYGARLRSLPNGGINETGSIIEKIDAEILMHDIVKVVNGSMPASINTEEAEEWRSSALYAAERAIEVLCHPPSMQRLIEEDRRAVSQGDGIPLTTFHAAKGREWGTVILPNLTDGICPHARSVAEENLEEERRCFFVALTRAANRLVLSSSTLRGDQPAHESRFIREMISAAPASIFRRENINLEGHDLDGPGLEAGRGPGAGGKPGKKGMKLSGTGQRAGGASLGGRTRAASGPIQFNRVRDLLEHLLSIGESSLAEMVYTVRPSVWTQPAAGNGVFHFASTKGIPPHGDKIKRLAAIMRTATGRKWEIGLVPVTPMTGRSLESADLENNRPTPTGLRPRSRPRPVKSPSAGSPDASEPADPDRRPVGGPPVMPNPDRAPAPPVMPDISSSFSP